MAKMEQEIEEQKKYIKEQKKEIKEQKKEIEEQKKEIEEQKRKIAQQEIMIEDTQKMIASTPSRQGSLERYLTAYVQSLAAMQQSFAAMRQSLATKEQSLVAKEQSLVAKEQSIAAMQQSQADLRRSPTLPQSLGLEDWLKKKEWWCPNTSFLSERVQIPRQGRVEQLHRIWRNIHNTFDSIDEKNTQYRVPLYFVHASSGVGKTRLLYELMLKHDGDIPDEHKDIASNVHFILVDFNGQRTPVFDAGRYPQNSDFTAPIAARMLFSGFCSPSVSWMDFVDSLVTDNTVDLGKLTIQIVLSMVRARIGHSRVVILIDELAKTTAFGPNIPSQFRRNICILQDIARLVAIFTSLDDELMQAERTASNRPVTAITNLPLLSFEDVEAILRPVLCKGLFGIRGQVPTSELREAILKALARLSGGHARTVEYFLTSIIHARPQEAIIHKCVSEAANTLWELYGSPSPELMRSCILAERVSKDDYVGMVKYRDCVATGQLVASFSDPEVYFTPQASPVAVYQWLLQVGTYPKDPFFSHLRDLLDCVRLWSPSSLESWHAYWELLIRKCRKKASHRSTSLSELYQDPPTSRNSNLLSSPVDGNNQLEGLRNFDKSATALVDEPAELRPNYVWRSSDHQNPGFDLLLFYKMANSSSDLLPLFVECKFSRAESSTSLGKSEVFHKHRLCAAFAAKHLQTKNFALLFLCSRRINSNAITVAPPNCLFIDRTFLRSLYGPTLSAVLQAAEEGVENVVFFGPVSDI